MTVFAFKFTRPDKRAPMICCFTNASAAGRTMQSIMRLTMKDYGVRAELYSPTVGWKVNFERLKAKSGEGRLTAELRRFQSAPASVRVYDAPRKITVWERATPEIVDWFETGLRAKPERAPNKNELEKVGRRRTGVDLYYERRRVATSSSTDRLT